MSLTAHIPSHRKPRRSASKLAVRAGVAGGVLSTLAMAGTASATPSAEPVHETTLEMPVLNLDLAAEVSSSVTKAAENTRAAAVEGELNALEETARTGAAAEAKQAKADAQQKADTEQKAKEDADRKAESERANRSTARASLQTKPSSSEGSSAQGTGTVTAPATGSAAAIVNFARAQVGKAYVMGGTGPSSFDCSGLVQAAYRQAGISLPRMSQAQSSAGTSVSLNALQPGDILYWGSKGSAYHVAVYVGGGKFVGAQNSSTGIVERSLSYDKPTGAVRVL
ncbi:MULTISPECIES: C40 family peptidase [unclassified Streptomyces]|uniref:C40 family peptidase n=1 Tax=unclassified Streptomyces TaxID=2593676 RepID=UPI000DC7D99F|nr:MULTISPECIES: C40 family peptidase [unclassified Streptomyces]AWZ05514.1 glycoside hydrolase [Streptomyces sp. ICC4]AWZ13650.1 glycoside hydrolase [Streptomyces sp. ICC1]